MKFLNFKYSFSYRPLIKDYYPALVVGLNFNGTEADAIAIIDTGASCTLFQPDLAILLGINITDGIEKNMSTADGGNFSSYGHTIKIQIEDSVIEEIIHFPINNIPRNLIGRNILKHYKFALEEKYAHFHLSPEI